MAWVLTKIELGDKTLDASKRGDQFTIPYNDDTKSVAVGDMLTHEGKGYTIIGFDNYRNESIVLWVEAIKDRKNNDSK